MGKAFDYSLSAGESRFPLKTFGHLFMRPLLHGELKLEVANAKVGVVTAPSISQNVGFRQFQPPTHLTPHTVANIALDTAKKISAKELLVFGFHRD